MFWDVTVEPVANRPGGFLVCLKTLRDNTLAEMVCRTYRAERPGLLPDPPRLLSNSSQLENDPTL